LGFVFLGLLKVYFQKDVKTQNYERSE
jgi:hypothetical protein